ncbi:CGNR zinc finger domain-containing protein [Saccharothrix sp. Mg75]|uniref:CGNR zinc finger domain-containing protein n=1 Tax=Saccharothrix sp. Mg75 TaxID=3445357 RepID=UPI003EEC9557
MHVFVSGRVSLDLVGTLKWRRDRPEELLPDAASVADWVTLAGLLSRPPRVDEADVAEVRELRELVYAAVRVDADRHVAAGALQAFADAPPVRPVLVDGRLERHGDLAAALSTVARDAIELVGSPADLERVRECGRPECTRLFVDDARGKPRRWCGMAECGNRMKAADYRRRRRLAQVTS